MRGIALLMITTLLLVPLSGCTGDDSEIVIVESEEPEWINERGVEKNDWNLSLEDNQWLEVQSAFQIFNYDDERYPLMLQMPILINQNTSKVGTDVNVFASLPSYSPFFGEDYHSCEFLNDGVCYEYSTLSNSVNSLIEWSIIYRIHEV